MSERPASSDPSVITKRDFLVSSLLPKQRAVGGNYGYIIILCCSYPCPSFPVKLKETNCHPAVIPTEAW